MTTTAREPAAREPAAEPPDATTRPSRSGPVQPLGPDSLTWRYFGDWRAMLVSLWAGSLQNMHPQLGAGVEQHSEFFSERWERLFRSIYPINGVVYDGPDAERTAHQVRGYHRRISGTDSQGRPYHALDPETFYWAHSTFFMSILTACEYFGDRLSEADKEQLYAEHVQWYRLYGMSMAPVPESWSAFQRYWDHMCTEVLEDNKATRDVLDLRTIDRPPMIDWLPLPVWRLLRPGAQSMVWLTSGMYHPAVRERLGLRWTSTDERVLRLLGGTVRLGWRLVPRSRRFHPRAWAGWQREEGVLAADAPLVETPRRFLPPPERRQDPKHYVPGADLPRTSPADHSRRSASTTNSPAATTQPTAPPSHGPE